MSVLFLIASQSFSADLYEHLLDSLLFVNLVGNIPNALMATNVDSSFEQLLYLETHPWLSDSAAVRSLHCEMKPFFLLSPFFLAEFKILTYFKITAFLNLEFKTFADFKILAVQNPDLKILANLKILAFQDPEFKIWSITRC